MKLEQQQQAQQLFFQTDLTKTQIASAIGISRTSLHNWIRENNWEYLRRTASAMPSLISAHCYHAMAQLSEHILSPQRQNEPITRTEVDTLYKLTLIVSKLKSRTVLSERMETFTGFMDGLESVAPDVADTVRPYVNQYIAACASINTAAAAGTRAARPAPPQQNDTESQLDKEDIEAWAAEREKTAQQPKSEPSAPPQPSPPPKVDLRKQLRGTASSGPGKAHQHPPASAA